MRIFGFVAVLLIASLGVASASAPVPEPTATPSFQVETGETSAHLTNGYGEWHSVYATGEWKVGRRASYVTFTEATRNGARDVIYLAGTVFPAAQRTSLSLEGSFSSTHAFSPMSGLSASVDHRLMQGWGYQLGVRHLTYPSLEADIESLGADRYFGNYHASYQVSLVSLSNVTGPAVNHRLTLTRYYGPDDKHFTSFVVSGGRDVENVNGLVAVYPLFEVHLAGRYWLGPRAAIIYDLFTLRQGVLYHQTGLQIGIRGLR